MPGVRVSPLGPFLAVNPPKSADLLYFYCAFEIVVSSNVRTLRGENRMCQAHTSLMLS